MFHQQLNYPIFLEEIDYLKFLRFENIYAPGIWSKDFFVLADGHPPLLSLGISALYFLTDSVLFIRVFILILNFACFSYFFLWCQRLKQEYWVTAILGGILLFSTVHSALMTKGIGDFLGFSLLLGWLYHRDKRENIRAMLCLTVAVLIRETHALPAIIYLVYTLIKDRKQIRTSWVEIIPGVCLFSFFVMGKVITGEWYSFTSKHLFLQFDIRNISKTANIAVFLRFLVPIAFLFLTWRKVSNRKYHFLAIGTCITGFALFLPYILHNHKARLLTPLMAPLIIALLYMLKRVRKVHAALFFLIFASLEVQFRYTEKEHFRRAKVYYNFVEMLKPTPETLVTGTWPFLFYTAYPNYGFPELPSKKINQSFLQNEYYSLPIHKEQLSNYKQIILYLAGITDDQRILEALCSQFPECPAFTFIDKNNKSHTFFLLRDIQKKS